MAAMNGRRDRDPRGAPLGGGRAGLGARDDPPHARGGLLDPRGYPDPCVRDAGRCGHGDRCGPALEGGFPACGRRGLGARRLRHLRSAPDRVRASQSPHLRPVVRTRACSQTRPPGSARLAGHPERRPGAPSCPPAPFALRHAGGRTLDTACAERRSRMIHPKHAAQRARKMS